MSPPAGHSTDAWPVPPTPPTGLTALADPLGDPETVGFVHVARGDDADFRYLTRTIPPTRAAAVVCVPTDASDIRAVYCVSDADRATAVDDFVAAEAADSSATEINRSVATREPQTPPGAHAVSILDDLLGSAAGSGILRVPPHIPHDAAVRLQQAGYELSSTAALAAARVDKTAAERDCLHAVQRAATHAMAETTDDLAAATTTDGTVRVDGDPVSPRGLERTLAADLAATGLTPATVRVRAAGTDATDPLLAGEGIVIHLSPQGPHGYHGRLTRTLVVDSDGGWDRRAFIAADAGLTAARRHCKPETAARTVAAEATAELTAYGFPPLEESSDGDPASDATADATSVDDAGGRATVHGVGLTPHEAPRPAAGDVMESGSILAIETEVVDPKHGRIRLGSLVEATPAGGEPLVDAPRSLTPTEAAADE